ncbi:hypothetical protein QN219_04800 [Sinorhizobium sp. 7-81]|uniref:hypothetical protein n=1 Tax=Sinorhizobium sp. 8-89 TaxID=3049089 RepID=UPI0024C2B433|nr:hypothetical protein [Sinorhizobium sp. 8-89]MDK1489375.1 hypothetical protein [Sinorhizobium sp. 8-89]
MADLSIQDLSDEDGGAVTFAAAASGGDKFVWESQAFLVVKNDDASSKTVTFTPAFSTINDERYGELTRSSIVVTVAAGTVALVPPLPIAFRNPSDNNKVAITYSAVTSLGIAVVRTA